MFRLSIPQWNSPQDIVQTNNLYQADHLLQHDKKFNKPLLIVYLEQKLLRVTVQVSIHCMYTFIVKNWFHVFESMSMLSNQFNRWFVFNLYGWIRAGCWLGNFTMLTLFSFRVCKRMVEFEDWLSALSNMCGLSCQFTVNLINLFVINDQNPGIILYDSF